MVQPPLEDIELLDDPVEGVVEGMLDPLRDLPKPSLPGVHLLVDLESSKYLLEVDPSELLHFVEAGLGAQRVIDLSAPMELEAEAVSVLLLTVAEGGWVEDEVLQPKGLLGPLLDKVNIES